MRFNWDNIDRRWIFLMMLITVAGPIIWQLAFPEIPTPYARAVFDAIEDLKPGDKVLVAFDYDPASEAELGPMATDFVHHCCEKKVKMYFVSLWPVGPVMVQDAIRNIIEADYPQMVYGQDYVNLGYKSGYEGVIKVIVTDLRSLYPTDTRGNSIDQLPMCRDVKNIQSMKLIIDVSAGYAGAKEWVQYAAVPYADKMKLVSGSTGVQSPQLFPYLPDQMAGLLGGIKGAAEYEMLVNEKYSGPTPAPKYQEALRRMGPQLFAHLLMIGLIIAGNVIYFTQRRREGRSQ
jgi:hypothetical protein